LLQVNVVVFDKTGTLTEGRLQLVASAPASGVSGEELLRWSAAAESSARHPLAAAVLAAAEAAGVEVPGSRDASTEPGAGVRATVEGRRCSHLSAHACCKPLGASHS
jgi:cation transport ATPase